MQIRLLMPASSHYSPSIDVYLLAYCGKPFLRMWPNREGQKGRRCGQLLCTRAAWGKRAASIGGQQDYSTAASAAWRHPEHSRTAASVISPRFFSFHYASWFTQSNLQLFVRLCWILVVLIFMHNNFADLENGGAKALKSFLFSCAVSILHPKSRNQPCPLGSRCRRTP